MSGIGVLSTKSDTGADGSGSQYPHLHDTFRALANRVATIIYRTPGRYRIHEGLQVFRRYPVLNIHATITRNMVRNESVMPRLISMLTSELP